MKGKSSEDAPRRHQEIRMRVQAKMTSSRLLDRQVMLATRVWPTIWGAGCARHLSKPTTWRNVRDARRLVSSDKIQATPEVHPQLFSRLLSIIFPGMLLQRDMPAAGPAPSWGVLQDRAGVDQAKWREGRVESWMSWQHGRLEVDSMKQIVYLYLKDCSTISIFPQVVRIFFEKRVDSNVWFLSMKLSSNSNLNWPNLWWAIQLLEYQIWCGGGLTTKHALRLSCALVHIYSCGNRNGTKCK